MTTNTKIATNTTNANATLDKYALAIAIMSNTPEICGAYYKDLPLALLEPHPTIQRKLVPDHYGSIAADWDITKCTPLTVSLQDDGTFYIIDGQHRYMAAKTIGVATLPCRIFRNLSPEEESKTFYQQNENCKRLTPRDTLRARLAIHEPVAESLERLCRDHGIYLFRNSSLDKPWLRALCDIEEILRLEGESAVDEIFDFVYCAGWHDEKLGYSKDLIRAAFRFRRYMSGKSYTLIDLSRDVRGMDLNECVVFAQYYCIGGTRETCLFDFFIECANDIDNVKKMMKNA